MPRFTCPFCSKDFDVVAFLAGASGYSTNTDSGGAPCLHCGKDLEFRIKNNHVEFGYTYWAGSMHFEGMKSVAVSGLRLLRSGDSMSIQINGRSIPLSNARG